MTEKYDLIVIGSGCGGAAAAVLGASRGYRTLLLEKNAFVGGRCATRDIRGFKMDHGHIVSRSDKGPHGEVLRLTNSADLIPPFAVANDMPQKYDFFGHSWQHPANYWKSFRVFKLWKMSRALGVTPSEYLNLTRLLFQMFFLSEAKSRELDRVDVATHVSRYTDSEYLHSLFGALGAVCFGALPDEASTGELFRSWGKAARHQSAGYPVNGEGIAAIPKSFVRAAERHGAHVRMKTPVKRILVENSRVKGVALEGETIAADMVISNAGVAETALRMVGETHFDPAYVARLKGLKYSYGGISLKYALNAPIIDWHHGGRVPRNFLKNMRDAMEGRVPEETSMMLVCTSNIDPALAPPGKQTLVVISPGPPAEPRTVNWKPWIESLKKQVADFVPGIDKHTEFCVASSPDVIACENGRMYGDAVGVAQTIDQMGDMAPSALSPIQGLYNVGADVGSSGIATEMATQSAIDLFQNILKP